MSGKWIYKENGEKDYWEFPDNSIITMSYSQEDQEKMDTLQPTTRLTNGNVVQNIEFIKQYGDSEALKKKK